VNRDGGRSAGADSLALTEPLLSQRDVGWGLRRSERRGYRRGPMTAYSLGHGVLAQSDVNRAAGDIEDIWPPPCVGEQKLMRGATLGDAALQSGDILACL